MLADLAARDGDLDADEAGSAGQLAVSGDRDTPGVSGRPGYLDHDGRRVTACGQPSNR
jgi:hypothetical protein